MKDQKNLVENVRERLAGEQIARFAEDERNRQILIDNCPDNGKTGWWIVDGLRHTGHAKASTAREAIEKCEKADKVQNWEMPSARFWTEKLPEVF